MLPDSRRDSQINILSVTITNHLSVSEHVREVIGKCGQTTRGVQKVRRLTQLTTRYLHHILSLFNFVSCNCNALGPAFLQSSQFVVEELWFLVFQPVICHADNVFVVSKSASFHEFFQFRKQIKVTRGQVWRIRWVTE